MEQLRLPLFNPTDNRHIELTSGSHKQHQGLEMMIAFNIPNLNLVWNECHRVLHKGCRLCINIGDQFARSVYYGRYKVISQPFYIEAV
jgi:hypothetical protein